MAGQHSQELFMQDSSSEASTPRPTLTNPSPSHPSPNTPATPLPIFSIPPHSGLISINGELKAIAKEVKEAASDCAQVAGLLVMGDNEAAIPLLTKIRKNLLELPVNRASIDCERHRQNAANMYQECRQLKRDLAAARQSLNALQVTEEEATRILSDTE